MAMAKNNSKSGKVNTPQDGPLSHKEILIVLSGLMTGMLLAALDQTIVSTALKNIVEDFNGLNHYTWGLLLTFWLQPHQHHFMEKFQIFMAAGQYFSLELLLFLLDHF